MERLSVFGGKTEEEIFHENMRLVNFVMCRFLKTHKTTPVIQYEDLEQEGYAALLNAIRTFDVTRKNAFSTYAKRCIENALQKYYMENLYAIRLPEYKQKELLEDGNVEKYMFCIPIASNNTDYMDRSAKVHERSAEDIAIEKITIDELLDRIDDERQKTILRTYIKTTSYIDTSTITKTPYMVVYRTVRKYMELWQKNAEMD